MHAVLRLWRNVARRIGAEQSRLCVKCEVSARWTAAPKSSERLPRATPELVIFILPATTGEVALTSVLIWGSRERLLWYQGSTRVVPGQVQCGAGERQARADV